LIGLPALQVKEKRAELVKLKSNSEFLRNYFASLVDFMISAKSYFSQVFYLNLLQNRYLWNLGLSLLVSHCLLTLNSEDSWRGFDHVDLRYKFNSRTSLLMHIVFSIMKVTANFVFWQHSVHTFNSAFITYSNFRSDILTFCNSFISYSCHLYFILMHEYPNNVMLSCL
jgi:hypothetical protein